MISPIHPFIFPPIHPLTGLHPSSTVLGHSCSLCSCILRPAPHLPAHGSLSATAHYFYFLTTSRLSTLSGRDTVLFLFLSLSIFISAKALFHLSICSSGSQHQKEPKARSLLSKQSRHSFVMQLQIKNGKWIQKTCNKVLVFISSQETLNILSPAPSSRSSKRNFRGQPMFRVYPGLK